MYEMKPYSATSATSPLACRSITHRDDTDSDVQSEILDAGQIGATG